MPPVSIKNLQSKYQCKSKMFHVKPLYAIILFVINYKHNSWKNEDQTGNQNEMSYDLAYTIDWPPKLNMALS